MCVQWKPHGEVSDSPVGQELMWLCYGDSSGIQDGKRPPWEAGTRVLGQQTKRTQYRQTVDYVYNSDNL
jgi:hypothetical protein